MVPLPFSFNPTAASTTSRSAPPGDISYSDKLLLVIAAARVSPRQTSQIDYILGPLPMPKSG